MDPAGGVSDPGGRCASVERVLRQKRWPDDPPQSFIADVQEVDPLGVLMDEAEWVLDDLDPVGLRLDSEGVADIVRLRELCCEQGVQIPGSVLYWTYFLMANTSLSHSA